MLVIVDIAGLVDQQHRDTVLDTVSAPQPWVVEHITDVQQRAAVGRANQDRKKLLVEHVLQARPGVRGD